MFLSTRRAVVKWITFFFVTVMSSSVDIRETNISSMHDAFRQLYFVDSLPQSSAHRLVNWISIYNSLSLWSRNEWMIDANYLTIRRQPPVQVRRGEPSNSHMETDKELCKAMDKNKCGILDKCVQLMHRTPLTSSLWQQATSTYKKVVRNLRIDEWSEANAITIHCCELSLLIGYSNT